MLDRMHDVETLSFNGILQEWARLPAAYATGSYAFSHFSLIDG